MVVKKVVLDVIMVIGGMIMYYYVVGFDYCFWMCVEVGDLGVILLCMIKVMLDLVGIFNFGKLIL